MKRIKRIKEKKNENCSKILDIVIVRYVAERQRRIWQSEREREERERERERERCWLQLLSVHQPSAPTTARSCASQSQSQPDPFEWLSIVHGHWTLALFPFPSHLYGPYPWIFSTCTFQQLLWTLISSWIQSTFEVN